MRRLRLFRGALSRWVCWGTNCDLGVPPVVFNDARAGLPMSQPRSSGPLSFPLTNRPRSRTRPRPRRPFGPERCQAVGSVDCGFFDPKPPLSARAKSRTRTSSRTIKKKAKTAGAFAYMPGLCSDGASPYQLTRQDVSSAS